MLRVRIVVVVVFVRPQLGARFFVKLNSELGIYMYMRVYIGIPRTDLRARFAGQTMSGFRVNFG